MFYNKYRSSWIFCFLALTVTLFVAFSGKVLAQTGATEPAAVVTMTNDLRFVPDTVRVKEGQAVLWKNSSMIVHSVTGDPGMATLKGSARLPQGAKPFNSGLLDPGGEFRHTFSVPGTYQYFCIPHEGVKMYGWVIVEEGAD